MSAPMGLMDHPTLGRVRYSITEVPEDPDGQVAATINLMRGYANQDAGSSLIKADVWKAYHSPDPLQDTWDYLSRSSGRMSFVADEQTAKPLGSWRPVVETLIRPVDQVVLSQPQGDCDDFSMYGAAHLLARGVKCSFVTVAADETEPTIYSHVYLAAYPPDGRRVAMDLSHGPALGWEVANRFHKRKEWPLDGSDLLVWAVLIAGGSWLAYQTFKGVN